MSRSSRRLSLVASAAAALTIGFVASCVDGTSPVGLGSDGMVSVSLLPTFSGAASASSAGDIVRIRIQMVQFSNDSVLYVTEIAVDPTADQWTLALTVTPPEKGETVYFVIELLNAQSAVEWSGVTARIDFYGGTVPPQQTVEVQRGPTSNLAVTGLSIDTSALLLLPGDSATLSTTVTTSNPASPPTVYWASRNPAVASVTNSGFVTARDTGRTTLIAEAGPASDSIPIRVVNRIGGIDVVPDSIVVDNLPAEVTFRAHVFSINGDTLAGAAVVWQSRDPWMLEAIVDEGGQADGRFRVFAAGVGYVRAYPVADPDVYDEAWVTTSFDVADLAVYKDVDSWDTFEGDTVRYTIVVDNYGPDDATEVVARDSLPTGMTLLSAVVTTGTFDTATTTWAMGTLAAGASDTLRLLARVDSGSADVELINTAWASSAAAHDNDPGNDTSSVGVYVLEALADLALYKDVDEYEVFEGDSVVYQVLLDNYGPDMATGIRVRDSLSEGLSFRSATATRGTFDRDSLIWRLDSLAAGESDTLRLVAVVDSGAVDKELVNTVFHLGLAEQVDDDPYNDTSSVEVYVDARFADIDVYKSRENWEDTFEGDTVTFVIEVSNWGPEDASGVTIIDSLGPGLTLIDTRLTRGGFSPPSRSWDLDSLKAGATDTLWMVARVDSGTVEQELVNWAWSVGLSDQVDDNPQNDTSTAEIFVDLKEADVALHKELASYDDVFEGDTVTFVIELDNWGPLHATGVRVRDSLQAGFTFIDATVSRGSFTAATGIWALDSLTGEFPDTMILRARVDSGTAFMDLENVVWSMGLTTEVDPDPFNDSSRVSVYVDQKQADLALYKDAELYEAHEGDTVSFEVVLENWGPFTAHGASVQEALPTGLTLLDGTVTTGALNLGTLLWSVGDLPAGSSDTLRLKTTVDAGTEGTVLTNVAFSLGLTTEVDPESWNDSTSMPVKIVPRYADIAVWKDVDDSDPLPGDTVKFTVAVENWGPFAASGLEIQDAFPGGLTIIESSVTTGAFDEGTGRWTLGTLAAEDADTLWITAEVDAVAATAEYTNVAWSMGPTPEVDPDGINDTSRVVVRVDPQLPGLGVRKYVDNPRPFERDTVTFFVDVGNNGPGDAGSISIGDTLPTGLLFLDAVTSAGSYDPITGVWAIDTLFDGFSENLTLRAQVDTGTAHQALVNTAWVQSFVGPSDGDIQNDVAMAEVRVGPRQADISLWKDVDNGSPFEGDTVKFTVEVVNWGPFEATNVTVRDTMSAGLRLLSHSVTRGAFDTRTGTWSLGNLAESSVDTLIMTARVDSGFVFKDLGNVAWSLGLTTEVDTDPASDTAMASVYVDRKEADVALFKDVDTYDPFEGDTVTFTVEVANWGPFPATGLTVTDTLPAGLTFLSAGVTRGTFDALSGLWTMGDMPDGAMDTLTLVARVDSGTVFKTLTNTAWANGLVREFDPDLSSDTASTDIAVGQREADVSLYKEVDESEPFEGDTVTFTVEVTNWGPFDANLLALRDSLAPGLTFVSASVTRGTFSDVTRVWTVGTLPADAVDTLTLLARVDSGTVSQTLENVAWHLGLVTEVDPDPSSDTSRIDVWVDQRTADVAVYKEPDEWAPFEGDTVTFTIELSNGGLHTARGLVVRDSLPAGLTFLSAQVTRGTLVESPLTWTVDSLPAYESDTLTLKVVVDSGYVFQDLTNRVWHAGPVGQLDPFLGNDTSEATITIDQREADVSLYKDVDDYAPFEDDTVAFTIYLDNYGPEDATDLTVRDSLPTGLTFVSATPSIGTFDGPTLTWTIDVLPASATDSLVLLARVDSGTVFTDLTNLAWYNGLVAQVDPDPSNDTADVTVSVDQRQADIALDKWVDEEYPLPGDTVTFTVVAENWGSNAATSVSIVDSLAPGLTFVSVEFTSGTFDDVTQTWSFDTLWVSDSDTLTILASVDAGTLGLRLKNKVWSEGLTREVEQDFFSDTAQAFVWPSEVDLELVKDVDDTGPMELDTVTYTLFVTNHGPSDATAIVVADTLPAGLTFISQSGGYDPITGIWNVGDLTPGDTAWLDISASVNGGTGGSTLWNRAWGTQVDQVDTVDINDADSVSVSVVAPLQQEEPQPQPPVKQSDELPPAKPRKAPALPRP